MCCRCLFIKQQFFSLSLSYSFCTFKWFFLKLFFCYSSVVNNVGDGSAVLLCSIFFIALWFFDRSPYDSREQFDDEFRKNVSLSLVFLFVALMTPVLTFLFLCCCFARVFRISAFFFILDDDRFCERKKEKKKHKKKICWKKEEKNSRI